MSLFQMFANKLEKTVILQTWKNSKGLYSKAWNILKEICLTSDINKLENAKKLKILREMCLHILWNILKYPKYIKYRQINSDTLYQKLQLKCNQLSENVNQIFGEIEHYLQQFGFEKYNDNNWYYPNDNIELLHLWECYQKWINHQTMLIVFFFFFFFDVTTQ
ncbi:hypothetical protein RFI_03298 [Reticulomyxa filosa]|uniref:Uncharacterized protein n=1 Tax=Reticulomyxa filosa TaxID=46433 RepID=X6P6T4_RETFI|nr:hypothetical protein RFI_03298 [Reticulomyxa filosa]|eukprot:ETO33804.1 hypothetical protein RFI_03298 [Reticulomyxa filosa]